MAAPVVALAPIEVVPAPGVGAGTNCANPRDRGERVPRAVPSDQAAARLREQEPPPVTDTPTAATCFCGSPTGDAGLVCRTHTADLARDLATVPDLVDELEITTTRQDRIVAEKHGGRSAERALLWNEHAAAKRQELNATLNAWALDTARLGEDERDRLAEHHYSDTAAVARWLGRNLRALRMHPDAAKAYDEITNAIREARQAIDRPPDQQVYGQCRAELDDGTICLEYLYGLPGRATIICRGCRSEHDAAKRRAWMFLHVRDMLGPIREVVACLTLGGIKTSEDKVRLMASRSRFFPAGQDASGKPLYRVSEVLTAIEDRYKHKPKSRSTTRAA